MSDDNDIRDRSAEPSPCERVTLIDTYETCDAKHGEIYLWCEDNVIRPARRIRREIQPPNRGLIEFEGDRVVIPNKKAP